MVGVPRTRGFDAEQVVAGAMDLFWTKGYGATSLSELTAELGIHPGSLYRTFGDKHSLFLHALRRYQATQGGVLAPALLAGGPVLPKIRAVLVGLLEIAAGEAQPRGCLVANTAGELLPGDEAVGKAVAAALAALEDAFLAGLRLAERQGEIQAGLDLPSWATTLTMLLQGMQLVVKADPDPRRLVRSVDVLLESLTGRVACRPS